MVAAFSLRGLADTRERWDGKGGGTEIALRGKRHVT